MVEFRPLESIKAGDPIKEDHLKHLSVVHRLLKPIFIPEKSSLSLSSQQRLRNAQQVLDEILKDQQALQSHFEGFFVVGINFGKVGNSQEELVVTNSERVRSVSSEKQLVLSKKGLGDYLKDRTKELGAHLDWQQIFPPPPKPGKVLT